MTLLGMLPGMLDVVSVYDNPVRWGSRLRNFKLFEEGMIASGVRLTTVELAHGERAFELPDRDGVRRVRLRANDICWRKENLARIGADAIPDWRYLAVIDGDMLMQDPTWVVETLHALQLHKVVQISTDLMWLGPKNEPVGTAKSCVFWYRKSRIAHYEGKFYYDGKPVEMLDYGYTGGAWAYQREAWDAMGGLLDVCLLGAADFHMAYALFDMPDLLLTDNDYTPQYRDALVEWKRKAREAIGEDVGVVPGMMYHLWHGPLKARRYSSREQILIRNRYDPNIDIVRDRNGLIHLAGNKPRMRDDIRDYFGERNEDSVDV